MAAAAPRSVASEQEKIHFYLNTALCQSPPTISKTEKATQYMKHFGILARMARGPAADGRHHITVVLTNNSLPETDQWNYRLSKKSGEGIRIRVLSSKKGKNNYMSLDALFGDMAKARNASYLPDMLVMCTHSKRADDLHELIRALKLRSINCAHIGIHHITLTIMFDEADKNISLIVNCLQQIDPLLTSTEDERVDNVLRDVHFITATPFEDFWKQLSTIRIDSLKNLNMALKDMDPDSVLHMTQRELMQQYRKLTDHHHRADVAYVTYNPVEYVTMVLSKIREEELAGKRKGMPLTLFAPSTKRVPDHIKMKDMLLASGIDTVVVINGESKGFYSRDGVEMIAAFNKHHAIRGELKDTLVKWRELHPAASLAITGYLCIERGITFCTHGFNFTDLIVSHCHTRNLASLIQLLGRANGGKEYVQIMNIWAHEDVVRQANEQIAVLNELLSRDPEEFKARDFRKMTKHERMQPAMTVPIVVQLTEAEYATLATMKKGRAWDEKKIVDLLEPRCAGLRDRLKGLKKSQISEVEHKVYPADDPKGKGGVMTDSYKKHIEDYVAAAAANRPFVSDVKPGIRATDFFQMFLDKEDWRVIVSIFYGSLIITDDEEDEEEEEEGPAPHMGGGGAGAGAALQ
jgi:hypothetical protein